MLDTGTAERKTPSSAATGSCGRLRPPGGASHLDFQRHLDDRCDRSERLVHARARFALSNSSRSGGGDATAANRAVLNSQNTGQMSCWVDD